MRRRQITRVGENVLAPVVTASVLALAICSTISVPPAPIEPAASARMQAARSLQVPEIARALVTLGVLPDRGWTIDALTVAARSLQAAEVTSALTRIGAATQAGWPLDALSAAARSQHG
jgi:hypothetical protein